MSYFSTQTTTVDLGGGNTVTLRKLNFGDMMDIWSAPALYTGPETTFGQRFTAEMTKRAITGWEGPDFEGRGVSPENIAQLPLGIFNKLIPDAVNLNRMGEEEGN